MADIKFKYQLSKIDTRDYVYTPSNQQLPDSFDLRKWDSLVEDQHYLGSCSGQATSNAYELLIKRLYPTKFVELSELFIYYNARTFDSTVIEDSGATLRNTLKSLKTWGVCSDDLWPYKIENYHVKPSVESYADAEPRKIPSYKSVATITDMIDAIYMGYPVVIGADVYSSFEFLNTTNYTVSNAGEFAGYHAMCVIGYNNVEKYFIVKNSYGTDWGLNGYCYMPFDYVTESVFERWIFDSADLTTVSTK